jgi:hypothetical protein
MHMGTSWIRPEPGEIARGTPLISGAMTGSRLMATMIDAEMDEVRV